MQGGQGKLIGVSPHTKVSAPTTGVLALPYNPKRYYATFINDSNKKVYLSFGELAPVGYGIPVYPNGFAFQIDRDNLYLGDVYARAESGTAILQITEGS